MGVNVNVGVGKKEVVYDESEYVHIKNWYLAGSKVMLWASFVYVYNPNSWRYCWVDEHKHNSTVVYYWPCKYIIKSVHTQFTKTTLSASLNYFTSLLLWSKFNKAQSRSQYTNFNSRWSQFDRWNKFLNASLKDTNH